MLWYDKAGRMITLCGHWPNLSAYVLTIAIAVDSDIEHLGLSGLLLDVIHHWLCFATEKPRCERQNGRGNSLLQRTFMTLQWPIEEWCSWVCSFLCTDCPGCYLVCSQFNNCVMSEHPVNHSHPQAPCRRAGSPPIYHAAWISKLHVCINNIHLHFWTSVER